MSYHHEMIYLFIFNNSNLISIHEFTSYEHCCLGSIESILPVLQSLHWIQVCLASLLLKYGHFMFFLTIFIWLVSFSGIWQSQYGRQTEAAYKKTTTVWEETERIAATVLVNAQHDFKRCTFFLIMIQIPGFWVIEIWKRKKLKLVLYERLALDLNLVRSSPKIWVIYNTLCQMIEECLFENRLSGS